MINIPQENIRATIRFTFWITLACALIGHAAAIVFAVDDRDRVEMKAMPLMIVGLMMSIAMGLWHLYFVHLLRKSTAFNQERDVAAIAQNRLDEASPERRDQVASGKRTGGDAHRGRLWLIVFILVIDVMVLAYSVRSPQAMFPYEGMPEASHNP